MEKLLKNIEFDDKLVEAGERFIHCNSPIILRVKGQCVLSEDRILTEGSIIVIHARKNVGILKGKDSSGKDVNLFTTCPHTVQLALPEEERKVFKSLEQLCLQEPRPKFVEIQFDDENEVNESVKNGDRLKSLLVERGAKGPLFMHFRNEKGKHVRLPVDMKASFTACPPDGKEYFISEIANINKAPLALFVQFTQRKNDTKNLFTSLGTIEIEDQIGSDLVFMTVKSNGKPYSCVCPMPDKLMVQIAKGAIQKTEDYEHLQSDISLLVPIEKFEAIHGGSDPTRPDSILLFQTEKVFSKKKQKGKKMQSLVVESEEDLSEKKRNSFMALFKDEKSKEPECKKEKKKKKNTKKSKDGEETDSLSRENSESEFPSKKSSTENGNPNQTPNVEFGREDDDSVNHIEKQVYEANIGAASAEVPVFEGRSNRKTTEDKKKWKFDLKSKFDKKEKKKKGRQETEESMDIQQSRMQEAPESSSEPCSPRSDDVCDDEYEVPEELKSIAAQNRQSESTHKEKGKSKTLISRTWKKMKKRRRALSSTNMQRPYSDPTAASKIAAIGDPADDDPPPLMAADYPEEIYEQIPGEFMSKDIYEEAVRAYGAYEKANVPSTETGDSGFDEVDKKQLDLLRDFTVPPPLPGNHPKMQEPRRGSSLNQDGRRISVDNEGFRRFYESMKKSENQMRSWGPDDLERGLRDLQLGHHAEKFNESQIDGSLLIDLDEAVLRDLGLSMFEARKLRKFVFGWRPDSMRDSLRQQRYKRESKDPSHWSTDMVANMIAQELGIPSLGKFFKANQVNGDLLRDIVIDDELLDFLLTGKASKLNAVKLKNYVLDGWRPPKKKDSNYEPFESQHEVVNTDQNYEPLSPAARDAPDTYELPSYPPPAGKTAGAGVTSQKVVEKRDNTEFSSPLTNFHESNLTRIASQEKLKGGSGSVNSLMQKYEKKSSNVDAPRPFTKVVSSHSSCSSKSDNRSNPRSPFVANMKKKFNEKS